MHIAEFGHIFMVTIHGCVNHELCFLGGYMNRESLAPGDTGPTSCDAQVSCTSVAQVRYTQELLFDDMIGSGTAPGGCTPN
jgi:hypothetical protein